MNITKNLRSWISNIHERWMEAARDEEPILLPDMVQELLSLRKRLATLDVSIINRRMLRSVVIETRFPSIDYLLQQMFQNSLTIESLDLRFIDLRTKDVVERVLDDYFTDTQNVPLNPALAITALIVEIDSLIDKYLIAYKKLSPQTVNHMDRRVKPAISEIENLYSKMESLGL